MRRFGALLTGLGVAVLVSGCVLTQTTDGSPLARDAVNEIVPGTSTRADVTRLLGTPDEIVYSNREHDRLFERAYRYERTRRKTTYFTLILFSAANSDKNSDHVVIFFDDRGVVEDVATRFEMDEPRYGTPF
ncbi:MAG: outer membrane protein assembly factor BamE [Deltaproteobacteria bacterium]|nr:MAG: outer membrane protein assembly factor BamE [Deltaproteobacteria bacterium]